MTDVVAVDDPADERLRDYRSLTDVALRTRQEPVHGLFIAEGELVIRRALAAGYPLRSAIVTRKWLDTTLGALRDTTGPVYVGTEELLRALTGFHVHRGALAAMARLPLPTATTISNGARRLVVLENTVNHTNLGAIARCAAGLGIDGLLLSPSCADPLYRRSVRVSMGAVLTLPYARCDRWPGAIGELRDEGFRVLALSPAEDATPLDRLRVEDDEQVALLLGTEGPGLSEAALAAAGEVVSIPMSGGVDSLNVAAAAAIACWAVRSRGPGWETAGNAAGSG